MTLYILNWNPKKWPGTTTHAEAVAACHRGDTYRGYWSTGSRTREIGPGDRAILLRQRKDRGLIASGTFTSPIYRGPHWNPEKDTANYADVTWDAWLPIEDRLPIDALAAAVPGVKWNRLQGSGVRPPDRDATLIEQIWTEHLERLGLGTFAGPDDLPTGVTFREGAVIRRLVNRYERNPAARAQAISLHGHDCSICGFNFSATYGEELGRGYIHVHHLQELSTLPDDYQVDPAHDLASVCPNCHAMLHRRVPALTPEELRQRLHTEPH